MNENEAAPPFERKRAKVMMSLAGGLGAGIAGGLAVGWVAGSPVAGLAIGLAMGVGGGGVLASLYHFGDLR
jgi:hypothetical protein